MFRRLQTYTYSWQFVDLEFVETLSVSESLRVEDLLLVGVQSVHGDFWHLWPLARPILASWKGQEGSIFLYVFEFLNHTHSHTTHNNLSILPLTSKCNGHITQTDTTLIQEESPCLFVLWPPAGSRHRIGLCDSCKAAHWWILDKNPAPECVPSLSGTCCFPLRT